MLDDLVKAFPSAVKVVWRDLPSVANPNAQLAAEAAREAFAEKGNAGFWKMHAQMATSPSSLARADVEQCGRDSGLDAIKLRTALDARTYRSAVDADAKAAADAGITATPAFVVGPYLLRGAPSFARLSRLVRRVIAEAPAPTPSAPSAGPVRFAVVDLVVGSGPAAERGNEVTIRYRGRLLAGGDVESGSRTFTLGGGSVIQAWNLGVVGMKVGGRRRLTVPPELAYGNHGVGSVIPPKAALVYDVDLVAIH